MRIYGFDINPLDQFNRTANNFTLYDPNLGRSLDVREWSALTGRPYREFYDEQRKLLQGYATQIMGSNPAITGGLNAIGIEKTIKGLYNINQDAINQVFEAKDNWRAFLDIVNNGSAASSKSVYGFDLETFGDIVHGQGAFGITEIALGKRIYNGSGVGRMDGGASIAVGVRNGPQADYLQGLIRDFERGKWNEMSQTDKVSLRRLTRYAGEYNDIFAEGQQIGVIPGNFTIVKKLSDEVLTVDKMRKGFENLQRVAQSQNPDDVVRQVANWFVDQSGSSDSLFYGANSAFDFNGMGNMMARLGFDEAQVNAVRGMQKGALDTVYLMRAAAATSNQSVKGFMKNIAGSFVGASVDEQIKAFMLGIEQEHFGFADIINEGNLVDHYATDTFAGFFGKSFDKRMDPKYAKMDINTTAFHIQRGSLMQVDGREFGYTPGFDGNKYGQVVHNMSIVGDTWRIDTKRTGVIKATAEGASDIYAATFMNVADEIMSGADDSSRFIITSDSLEGLQNRIQDIIKNSTAYDLSGAMFPDGGFVMDDPLVEGILEQRQLRYADLGRREFAKFFSPGDSRINNGTVTTGYNGLHNALHFEESLQKYLQENPDKKKFFTTSIKVPGSRIEAPVTKESVAELMAFNNEYIKSIQGTEFSPVIFSSTQAKSYLGMHSRIATEYSLLKTIDDTIAKAYQGQSGVGIDIEKTAIASRIYAAATDILFENTETSKGRQYRFASTVVPLADMRAVDIQFTNTDGVDQFFRVNAKDAQSASRDVSRLLRREHFTVDQYNSILADLRNRGLISNKFADVADSLELEPYSAGQSLGAALSKGIIGEGGIVVSESQRLRQDISEELKMSQLRGMVDEDGAFITAGRMFSQIPEYHQAIMDKMDEIIANRNKFTYTSLGSEEGKAAIRGMIPGLADALNIITGDDTRDTEVKNLFEQIFYKGDKRYALSNRVGEGIQGFVVSPGNVGVAAHMGDDAYLILTNQAHVGKAMEFLGQDSDKLQEAFRSYSNIMGTELKDHAAILPLPRIHKWSVGDGGAAIQAVQQGEDFYKILVPTLRTFKGDDGRLRVSYEDPAFQVASIYRKLGGRIGDYAAQSEFEKASSVYRRAFNELVKESPSFTSRRGVDKMIHLNTNEAMRGFEVRLHGGLTSIFEQLVLTPTPNGAGPAMIDGGNLNTAQQIVHAFGQAKGMRPEDFNNDYDRYFRRILEDKDFQEVFHSRMVYGKIGNDRYLGRYLGNDAAFQKPIYAVMQDLILDTNYRPTLEAGFDTSPTSFYSILNTLEKLPEVYNLDAVGSESSVAHGSYFLKKYGSFRSQSNLYSMMRPPYIQQGNAQTYNLADMNGLKKSGAFKYITGAAADKINPVYFGMGQMTANEFTFREAIQRGNDVIIDEGQFMGKVKTMGDADAFIAFRDLKADKTVGMAEVQKILRENNSSLQLTDEMYDRLVEAARQDLGPLHEDSGWLAPALKASPLFTDRDSIGFKWATDTLDKEETAKRLQAIVDAGGKLDTDTIIGKSIYGRDIYYGKSPALLKQGDIEKLLTDGRANLETLGIGDIFDDKIFVNGMEKRTTKSINVDTLLRRMFDGKPEEVEELLKQYGLDEKARSQVGQYIGDYIFSRVTDGAVVAGNFNYMKHGGIVGLANPWNLIQTKYVDAAKENAQIGHNFAGSLNAILVDMGENDVSFRFSEKYGRLIGNDDALKNPAAFYERLLKEMGTGGILSSTNPNLSDTVRRLNADIYSAYRDMAEKNISLSVLQRQIMNEHMGTKFTIDQRIEQGLRFQGLHGPNGTSTRNDVDNLLVDAFKRSAFKYTGYSPDMIAPDGRSQYGALELIQKQIGLARGHERAIYNREAEDVKRSIAGMSESVKRFLRPMSIEEAHGTNVVEIGLDELLDEVRRGGHGNVEREDLMESIFFVDGEPSDFLKRHAIQKTNLDLKQDSYSIFVNAKGYDIKVDNTTPLQSRTSTNGPRTVIEGFNIPIYSSRTIGEGQQVFQPSQGELAKMLSKVSGLITSGKPQDELSIEIGNVLRDYYKAIDDQTNYLKKSSEIYKFSQTWTIPHSHQFLSQDQLAPLIGIEDPEFLKAYKDLRSVESKVKEASLQAGDLMDESIIEEYRAAKETFQGQFDRVYKEVFGEAGDISKLEDVIKLTSTSDYLDLAQREVINGKVVNGFAVAVSEQGLEGMGLRMGDVAQGLVGDYERAAGRAINGQNSFEMVDEFFGHIIDQRIDAAEQNNVMLARRSDIAGRYAQLRQDLSGIGLDLSNKDTTIAEAADKRVAEMIAAYTGDDAAELTGISIRDLNKRISENPHFLTGLPEDIRNFYSEYEDIFRKSGIAQSYMSEVGVRGLLTRYPVFNLQPWVKVVLDPNMQGFQIRASNPVINKLIHLDNDGDTLMLGILAQGSSLVRDDGRSNNILRYHSQVYRRNLQTYGSSMMAEAFNDISAYDVNDASNYIKQEAKLLQIIDDEGYKAALSEYVHKYARTNHKGKEWADYALAHIDNKTYAGVLEGALNSSIMSKFYKERIASTLNNENALIAATVARIRKDYIGYISTPNYRTRETLNHTFRKLQEMGGRETDLGLLKETMLSLTSFEHASGGLFSAIEQTVIDPKHARDGLTPIGIARYSNALKGLVGSRGNVRQAERSLETIFTTVGPKAMGIQNSNQAKLLAGIITNTSTLQEYKDLIKEASKLVNGQVKNGYKIGPGLTYNIDVLDSQLGKLLDNALPFKALYEVSQKVPEFQEVWENIVEHGTVSSISQYYSGLNEEQRKQFLRQIHGLGFSEDTFALMLLGDDMGSAKLPPFVKGNMYFQIGGGTANNDVGTRAWVYQGDDTFFQVVNGKIDKSKVMTTRDIGQFDNIGIAKGTEINFNAYIKDAVLKAQTDATVAAVRAEKYLNHLTIGADGRVSRSLPAPLSTRAVTRFDGYYPTSSVTKFADQVIGGRAQWGGDNGVAVRVAEQLRAYDAGIGVEIPITDNMPKTGVDLLRQINHDIAQRGYRDLTGGSPSAPPMLADEISKAVMDYFGGSQQNFNTALGRANSLPEGFDLASFKNQLEEFGKSVYNIGEETNALNVRFDETASELARLKKLGLGGSELDALEKLVADRTNKIGDMVTQMTDNNKMHVQTIQDTVYKALRPAGSTTQDFEKYATTVFRWGDTVADKDSLVGFGTYMGRRMADLSVGDIQAIKAEAQGLRDTAQQTGQALSSELDYTVTRTLKRLENITPDSKAKSVLSGNRMDSVARLMQAHEDTVIGANQTQAAKQTAKSVRDAMKKQTLSGTAFDKARSLNITGKHIGIAIGAMAALGLTNKLLHKRSKTPLEAKGPGGGASPIINGRPQQDNGAPPSVSTGSPTIYHDAQSGLNFKVSAQTKRRLNANGYGGIVHGAGGGAASVHVYNDTRGVSDNWLSNKFSELAE